MLYIILGYRKGVNLLVLLTQTVGSRLPWFLVRERLTPKVVYTVVYTNFRRERLFLSSETMQIDELSRFIRLMISFSALLRPRNIPFNGIVVAKLQIFMQTHSFVSLFFYVLCAKIKEKTEHTMTENRHFPVFPRKIKDFFAFPPSA